MNVDRFHRYEENFLNCSRIISRSMVLLERSGNNVDNFIANCVDIEGELAEAEGYMKAMQIEFRTMSSVEKRSTQTKVNDYKDEMQNLQKQYTAQKSQVESILLKGQTSEGTRQRLLAANGKLDDSTATLEQTRNIIADTEQIGTEILTDLEKQKETIQKSKENVSDTKGLTVEAKNLLRMMGNRAIMHKVGVAVTIVLLFGAIIGVGYEGFVKN